MHEWPQKTRQNDKHARPASVQPCGGEITESVVGMVRYKTCSRYGSRLRMCMDDSLLCGVERI